MDLHTGPQGNSGQRLERGKECFVRVRRVCTAVYLCPWYHVRGMQTDAHEHESCMWGAYTCFACGAMHILPWFVTQGSCVVQLRGARACGARARTAGVQHAIVVVCLWCVCTDTFSRVVIEACRCPSVDARRTTPPTLRVTHTQRGGRCPFGPRHEPFHLPEKLRGTRSVTSPATDNQLVPMKFKSRSSAAAPEGRITTSIFVRVDIPRTRSSPHNPQKRIWKRRSSIAGEAQESRTPSGCVRGLYIATGQYSSFCGCAVGLMLGVLDIMGVEVQNRERVEVRENVGARETEEEDKTRKQQTLRHVMTCG